MRTVGARSCETLPQAIGEALPTVSVLLEPLISVVPVFPCFYQLAENSPYDSVKFSVTPYSSSTEHPMLPGPLYATLSVCRGQLGLTPFSGSPSFSVQQNGIRRLPGRVTQQIKARPSVHLAFDEL